VGGCDRRQAVTQVYEGEKSFNLTAYGGSQNTGMASRRFVRSRSPLRRKSDPAREIATITEETSPSVIYREDGLPLLPVKFRARPRPTVTITDAQGQITDTVHLAPTVTSNGVAKSTSSRRPPDVSASSSRCPPSPHVPDLQRRGQSGGHVDCPRQHSGACTGGHLRLLHHGRAVFSVRGDGIHLHLRA